MKTREGTKGFTLVELMVVIVILGIIAAITVPSFVGYIERGRVTTAATDAAQLASNLNTLNLAMGGTLTMDDLDTRPDWVIGQLSTKGLLPQLSGDYEVVLTYIDYNSTTRLFFALPDNEIRELM